MRATELTVSRPWPGGQSVPAGSLHRWGCSGGECEGGGWVSQVGNVWKWGGEKGSWALTDWETGSSSQVPWTVQCHHGCAFASTLLGTQTCLCSAARLDLADSLCISCGPPARPVGAGWGRAMGDPPKPALSTAKALPGLTSQQCQVVCHSLIPLHLLPAAGGRRPRDAARLLQGHTAPGRPARANPAGKSKTQRPQESLLPLPSSLPLSFLPCHSRKYLFKYHYRPTLPSDIPNPWKSPPGAEAFRPQKCLWVNL